MSIDKRFRTIDGVEIVDGLIVWDYDLRIAVVDLASTRKADPNNEYHSFWDGFFEMRTPEGGRSSIMDGGRMWRRHPSTGQHAEFALRERATS